MVHDGCNYFFFWAISYPFTAVTAQKIKIFNNWKKVPGDIIISHKCTKNYDQMIHSSWDKVCDRCNCYFSFWAIFCLFIPLTAQKSKLWKNETNRWRYHLAYMYQKLWLNDQGLIEKNSLGVSNVNMSTTRYILRYYTLYRLLKFRSKRDINLLFCFQLQY